MQDFLNDLIMARKAKIEAQGGYPENSDLQILALLIIAHRLDVIDDKIGDIDETLDHLRRRP